ncbi:Oidioi.mRNA.OKI2018_I69.chr1.g487.t1.cds [Oikopleura dioica]|uniref:Oidioi.mRNA.OKI2018_I69.chr1.g487.t1.cds n=1 Tax=Oikopleura dioica TaxID=34765 RepID=A0ABN7SLP4_OIKDI|nr:Oidioi.mRNA.OKI2018_I69.chr1.g487.t1.cds [Oikopleura dioica]
MVIKDFEELPVLENRPREMITEKKDEKGSSRVLESILSTKTLAPSAAFQQALLAIMEENQTDEKKSLDDMNWESSDSFQSSRPPTQVLMDCRRMSADDNIIGLRLGPNRRRGGIIGEIDLTKTAFVKTENIDK